MSLSVRIGELIALRLLGGACLLLLLRYFFLDLSRILVVFTNEALYFRALILNRALMHLGCGSLGCGIVGELIHAEGLLVRSRRLLSKVYNYGVDVSRALKALVGSVERFIRLYDLGNYAILCLLGTRSRIIVHSISLADLGKTRHVGCPRLSLLGSRLGFLCNRGGLGERKLFRDRIDLGDGLIWLIYGCRFDRRGKGFALQIRCYAQSIVLLENKAGLLATLEVKLELTVGFALRDYDGGIVRRKLFENFFYFFVSVVFFVIHELYPSFEFLCLAASDSRTAAAQETLSESIFP